MNGPDVEFPAGKGEGAGSGVARAVSKGHGTLLQEVLIELGRRLAATSESGEIARALAAAARRLVQWESCSVHFCTRGIEIIRTMYIADTIDGELRELPEHYSEEPKPPTPTVERTLREGAFYIERNDPWYENLTPFGDPTRLSRCIVFIPIRQSDGNPIGVAAFHTYREDHFTPEIIPPLELLASFCAAAIERCRAQDEIREQKERYRLVLEQAGMIPYERDVNARSYLFVGEGFERLTGFPAHQLTAEIWEKLLIEWNGQGPLSGLAHQEAVDKVSAGETKVWRGDMLIRRPDGKERWVHDASVIVADELGKPARSLGILQDVSERKEIETNLKKSERELWSVLANIKDVIARFDCETRILLVNPAVRAITGKEPAELIGRTLAEIATGTELCHFLRQGVPHCFSSGKGLLEELREVESDGNVRHLQCRLIPEFAEGDSQRPTSVLMALQDITRLKSIQESLRDSEQRLRILVENLPAILWTVDRDLVFTLSMGAGLPAIGSRPMEYVGKTLMEVVGVDDPNATPIREHHLALKGQSIGFGIDFAERAFRVTLEPQYAPDGTVTGVAGLAQDITAFRAAEEQRRQLEAQIQQTQKLESLGVLAGGIAHDFNNILATILGNANIALMEINEGSELHDVVHNIERGGQRAAELVRQILTYSGKGRMDISVRDLNELIREMIELLHVSISKAARLELNLAKGEVPLEADASQVQQVIMNLITNASEALPDGAGTITIRTGRAQLDASELPSMLCGASARPGEFFFMEVADTGCGMDEKTRLQIFDPFFTTKFTGRGLGLAAVLGIIQSHRGALRVESEPGKGSVFRVYFPVATSKRASTPAPRAGLVLPSPSGCILVVDDEADVRSVLARMLKNMGYDVLAAESGEEALRIHDSDRNRIAAVFLDATMPGMSGKETLAHLRAASPQLPVVMMSGYAMVSVEDGLTGLATHGFLRKPFMMSDVRNVLAGALPPDPED